MSFAIVKELAPPSAVDGAAWARLLAGSAESFLAVARGSVLDVYRLGAEGGAPPSPQPAGDSDSAATSPPVRLQLVTSTALSGNIASIRAVTLAGRAAAAVARCAPVAESSDHDAYGDELLGGPSSNSSGEASSLQALLLTFAPGKVAVVGLDPFSVSLRTLAMLNLEDGALGPGCSVTAPPRETLIQRGLAGLAQAAVDPLQWAIAMLVTDDVLAVIPLRRGGMHEEEEGDEDNSSSGIGDGALANSRGLYASATAAAAASGGDAAEAAGAAAEAMDRLTKRVLGTPYLVRLRDVGRRSASDNLGLDTGTSGMGGLEGEVRDVAFLHGYRIEPALGVLVSKGFASTSRLASLGHNTTFAAVTVDASASAGSVGPGGRRAPVPLWRYDGLPHDCHAAIPVPEPLGGVLVVSNNALFYLAQYSHCALALNAFAAATVNTRQYKLDVNSAAAGVASQPLALSAEAGTKFAFLTPHHAMVTQRDGNVLLLTLHMSSSGGADVSHMSLTPTGIRGPPMPAGLELLRASDVDAEVVRHSNSGVSVEAALASAAAAAAASHSTIPPSHFGLTFSCGRVSDSLLCLYALTLPSSVSVARKSVGPSAAAAAAMAVEDADGLGEAFELPAVAAEPNGSGAVRSNNTEDDDDAALYGGGAAATASSNAAEGTTAADGSSSAAVAAAAEEEDEDALLYGKSASLSAAAAKSADGALAAGVSDSAVLLQSAGVGAGVPTLSLYPVDYLPCTGPVTASAIGRQAQTVAEDADEPPLSAPASELALACGYGHAGKVVVTQSALRPLVTTDMQLPGGAVTGAWFVEYEPQLPLSSEGDSEASSAASSPSAGGVLLLSTTTNAAGDAPSSAATRVLALDAKEGGLSEVPPEACELVTDGATLAAGLVLTSKTTMMMSSSSGARLVQVHPSGVRVTAPDASSGSIGSATQDVLCAFPLDVGGLAAPPGVEIASADVRDPCVLLRLTDGTIRLLIADVSEGELLVEAPPGQLGGSSSDDVSAAETRPFDPVTACCLVDAGVTAQIQTWMGPRPQQQQNEEGEQAQSLPLAALLAHRSGALTLRSLPSFAVLARFGSYTPVPPAKKGGNSRSASNSNSSVTLSGGAHVGAAVLVDLLLQSSSSSFSAAAAHQLRGRKRTADGAVVPDAAGAAPAHDDFFSFGEESAATKHANEAAAASAATSSDAAEPCVDPAQENNQLLEEDMTPDVSTGNNNSSTHKLPRTFITDIAIAPSSSAAISSATASPLTPLAHIIVVTSADDVYAYALLPPAVTPGSAASSSSDLKTAVFLDSGLPLQYSRAGTGLRAVRLPGVPGCVTRYPDTAKQQQAGGAAGATSSSALDPEHDYAALAAREGLWQTPRSPRLVPFSTAGSSGWTGIAVLTPRPLWLLGWRGGLVPVPMGVPDVSGAGGSGCTPGDAMMSLSSGQTPVPALCPFNSPLTGCPGGLLTVTQGRLQFGLLPQSPWPSAIADGGGVVPVRCPYELLTESVVTATEAEAPEMTGDGQEAVGGAMPGTTTTTSSQPPAPAHGAAVLALAQPINGSNTNNISAICSPSEPSYGSVHVPHPHACLPLPLADLPPSSLPHVASLPLTSHALGGSPYALAFCEGASKAAGAAQVKEWHKARVEAAKAAAGGGPVPTALLIPPTPSQLECSILPVYAAAVTVHMPRDHAADMAAVAAMLDAAGGEWTQADHGPHLELAEAALQSAAATSGTDLTSLAALGPPPMWDSAFEIRLYAGSLHTSAAAAPHIQQSEGEGQVLQAPWAAPNAGWAQLPGRYSSFPLLPGEHVLCMAEMSLGGGGGPQATVTSSAAAAPSPTAAGTFAGLFQTASSASSSAPAAQSYPYVIPQGATMTSEPLLVVGTGMVGARGEGAVAAGRVLVFRIDVGPPTQSATGAAADGSSSSSSSSSSGSSSSNSVLAHPPRLVLLYESGDVTKGPVQAVAPLASRLAPTQREVHHLALATGRQVQVMEWHPKRATAPGQLDPGAAAAGSGTSHPGLSSSGWSPIGWELRPIARHDTPGVIASVSVAAGYLSVGDATTGLHFLRWREEDHSLLPLARDPLPLPLCCGEMVIHDKTLGLLGIDGEGNVGIWQYSPKEAGNRLVPVADVALGTRLERGLLRHRISVPFGTPAAGRRRTVLLGGAPNGSLLAIAPLEEQAFKRLLSLQKMMTYALPQPAGLHPKAWRLFSSPHRAGQQRQKHVLDGQLLGRWAALDARTQRALVRAIGSTVDRVTDSLRQLELALAVY